MCKIQALHIVGNISMFLFKNPLPLNKLILLLQPENQDMIEYSVFEGFSLFLELFYNRN